MARESKKQPVSRGINWRITFAILLFGLIGVSTAVAGYKVSLFVASDPQFTLSPERKDALTILGLTYASRFKVQRVFAADFEHSIFSVPLAERRRRLLAIDWIEDASVSRVWPDRLVIHIRERKVCDAFLRPEQRYDFFHGIELETEPAVHPSHD